MAGMGFALSPAEGCDLLESPRIIIGLDSFEVNRAIPAFGLAWLVFAASALGVGSFLTVGRRPWGAASPNRASSLKPESNTAR